jgi:hypothetical protein
MTTPATDARDAADSAEPADLRELVDLDRYPITQLGSPVLRARIEEARRSLRAKGVAIFPGFLTQHALVATAQEIEKALPGAHLEDVAVGTPYLELADPAFPVGHPRRTDIHSKTWVIAYDRVPKPAAIRRLYEWDGMQRFVGDVLEREPLYRYADPLGALNLTCMEAGHVQGWHFDSAEFVVSLALQASEAGGEFECAPFIRSEDDEHYDEVARVLQGGASARVEVFPMTPGTLMIFQGRRSLHRVSPVHGGCPRTVALFAYDSRPGTDSSDLLKMVRYGRTAPVTTSG